jgi:hypothetical protein
MRDLYSNLAAVGALAPAVLTADALGTAVDLSAASGCVFVVTTGALVGAALFAAKVQESADGVTWGDVPAKWVQSNAPAALAASSTYRLGYTGKLKFARLFLDYTSGTSLAVGAVAILKPHKLPVA